jgi:small subunit ribosomal protein S16
VLKARLLFQIIANNNKCVKSTLIIVDLSAFPLLLVRQRTIKYFMAVRIRLLRQGAKKQPNYLIIAVEGAKRRDGKFLARIGQYFPKEKDAKKKIIVDKDLFKFWTAKGASVTSTVAQLVKNSI